MNVAVHSGDLHRLEFGGSRSIDVDVYSVARRSEKDCSREYGLEHNVSTVVRLNVGD